jgi:hypothetical protein
MHAPNTPPEVDRESLAITAISVAPAAVGCAIGLLLSNHLKRRHRAPLATVFLTLAAAAVVPIAVDTVNRLIRGPQSRHGAIRTLEGIRSHDGLPYADSTDEEQSEDATMLDFPKVAQTEA